MRIVRKINQHRRDFTAVYECEGCGNQKTTSGYDDHYFHSSVIPAMKCESCGEAAPQDAPATAPDVPAGVVL